MKKKKRKKKIVKNFPPPRCDFLVKNIRFEKYKI